MVRKNCSGKFLQRYAAAFFLVCVVILRQLQGVKQVRKYNGTEEAQASSSDSTITSKTTSDDPAILGQSVDQEKKSPGERTISEPADEEETAIHRLVREYNERVVAVAPRINLTYSPLPHTSVLRGARDAMGVDGYVPDVTSLAGSKKSFAETSKEHPVDCHQRGPDDEDYIALQRIRVAQLDNDTTNIRLLCLVYTAQHHHDTQLKSIRETWAPHCDGFMAASNFTDDSLNAVNMTRQGPEDYRNMWQKVRSTWAFVYDHFYDNFDWFHIGGDDMLLIAENLKHYVASEEVRKAENTQGVWQTPLYLGDEVSDGDNVGIHIGGPGYTMNKAALKLLVTQGLESFQPNVQKSIEDTLIGRLFRQYNVLPYRTSDSENRHRYHHWPPGRHYLNHEHPFYKKLTRTYNYTWGKNYSSPYSVSFHYIDRYEENQMRRLYALLYGTCDTAPVSSSAINNAETTSTAETPASTSLRGKSRGSNETSTAPCPKRSNETTGINIGCVIYTFHGARELIQESYNTWGQYCDFFEAYSDEEWEYRPTKRTVPLRPPPGRKNSLWNDVKNIWLDLAARYESGTLDADYVVFSGDDAFWILSALRNYLSAFPPNERLYMGGVDGRAVNTDFPWVGGAGYVISRRLIEERALDAESCPYSMGQEEDVRTSRCLYGQGVNFTDTRDANGFRRFCRHIPTRDCGDRVDKKEPSEEVVLFHYTRGDVRWHLFDKYYGGANGTTPC